MKQFVFFLFVIGLLACSRQKDSDFSFEVGASQQSINPPIGAFIAGDQNDRQFTGIHDSLYVKAITIGNENANVSILTFDCIGMLYPVLERIRNEVANEEDLTGLNPDQKDSSSL